MMRALILRMPSRRVAAADEQIAEVMIVFSDIITRAVRSVKVSESSFQAFQSPAFPHLGSITSTGISFSPEAMKADGSIPLQLRPHFSTNILSIDLTPGQRPGMLDEIILSGKCKGVILKSHGAGSVPTEGEFSFLPFIEHTVQKYNIPVIVSTKFLGGNAFKEVNDECAVLAIKAGAIPGGDLTDVMTEVKLMWLLAQSITSYKEVAEDTLKDYIGEVSPTQYHVD